MPDVVSLEPGLNEWLWRHAGGAVVETTCRLPGHLIRPGWVPLVILPEGWCGPARDLAFAAALEALRFDCAGLLDSLRDVCALMERVISLAS